MFYFGLFYSRLCPSTARSSPPPKASNFLCPLLSLSIPLPVVPQCHLSNGVLVFQPMFFICHSVLLIVHLLSFIRVMCPAHFHFALVKYRTMSVTLVFCLMMLLRFFRLVWHLAFYFPWLVCLFHVCSLMLLQEAMSGIHMSLLVRVWLKAFHFRLSRRCLSRKISVYFTKTLHPACILIETSCLVPFFIATVCSRYVQLVTFSISILSTCTLSVLLIFVIICFPVCILRPIFKISSFSHGV